MSILNFISLGGGVALFLYGMTIMGNGLEKLSGGKMEKMLEKKTVPCTSCRYCTDHCPMGLDIPLMMATLSELRFSPVINIAMRLEGLPSGKQASACIGCGACAQMCPQRIEIPLLMTELTETLRKIPKWTDICLAREKAAKELNKK